MQESQQVSVFMKCRYVEKVKLADLRVTINLNSFNLVEPLLLTVGEAGSINLDCLLGAYTRADNMPLSP